MWDNGCYVKSSDALIFNHLIIHGSSTNTSPEGITIVLQIDEVTL